MRKDPHPVRPGLDGDRRYVLPGSCRAASGSPRARAPRPGSTTGPACHVDGDAGGGHDVRSSAGKSAPARIRGGRARRRDRQDNRLGADRAVSVRALARRGRRRSPGRQRVRRVADRHLRAARPEDQRQPGRVRDPLSDAPTPSLTSRWTRPATSTGCRLAAQPPLRGHRVAPPGWPVREDQAPRLPRSRRGLTDAAALHHRARPRHPRRRVQR